MTAISPSPFVRLYNAATDFENVIHIFRETCDVSLKVEPIWTIGSYIWCRPYLYLTSKTCFVLDDGHGTAVGYILSAPNTGQFCDAWKSQYVLAVRDELEALSSLQIHDADRESLARRKRILLDLLVNDPHRLTCGGIAAYVGTSLGHLHIDILPSYQRRGFGKQLVQALLKALRVEGCTSVYLGMVASNIGAAAFYERCGFRRLPHVLDNGESGDQGRTSGNADGGEELYYIIDV